MRIQNAYEFAQRDAILVLASAAEKNWWLENQNTETFRECLCRLLKAMQASSEWSAVLCVTSRLLCIKLSELCHAMNSSKPKSCLKETLSTARRFTRLPADSCTSSCAECVRVIVHVLLWLVAFVSYLGILGLVNSWCLPQTCG